MTELRTDSNGIPYHVQSIELVHTDRFPDQHVRFTLCTGKIYLERIANIDKTYLANKYNYIDQDSYLTYLATKLEQFVESRLGLFYNVGQSYE